MMKNKAKYEEVKALIKPAKFICKGCGRAAAKAINLCDPEPLYFFSIINQKVLRARQ